MDGPNGGSSAESVAEALARLVVEDGERLTRLLVGVTRDHATAQDVLQVAYTRLLTHGADVPAEQRQAWLYRVAVNEALNRKRQTLREAKACQALRAAPSLQPPLPPMTALVAEERKAAVRAAVADLPTRERQIVTMRIGEGLTFQAIADQTGEPLGTVLWRMRQAIARLRTVLADETTTPDPT